MANACSHPARTDVRSSVLSARDAYGGADGPTAHSRRPRARTRRILASTVTGDRAPDRRERAARSSAAENRTRRLTMKIRVLVVDDFPLQREGLTASLEVDQHIEVVGEADDGRSGLALARQLRPDVAVVDMRMPGLGGPALVGRLRDEVPECRVL